MGYTGIDVRQVKSVKDFILDEIRGENEKYAYKPIASRFFSNEAFIVVETTDKLKGISYKSLWIALFRKSKYEFTYKFLSEKEGPFVSNVPSKQLLDLLSDVDLISESEQSRQYAKDFRNSLYKAIEEQSKVVKLKNGDVIQTSKPIQFFRGHEYSIFEVEKQGKATRYIPIVLGQRTPYKAKLRKEHLENVSILTGVC